MDDAQALVSIVFAPGSYRSHRLVAREVQLLAALAYVVAVVPGAHAQQGAHGRAEMAATHDP
jgi:hypothetical protein